jgi:signal transduction histidine kinase
MAPAPRAVTGPLSSRAVTAFAVIATSLFALLAASQTYLSMLSHGHSFVRLLVWQLGAWSLWAVAAPWIVRASQRLHYLSLAAFGVGLTVAHALLSAALLQVIQPFAPLSLYDTFGHAFSDTFQRTVLFDPLICLLLIVGGRAVAAYEQARHLQLRESQLESELARAQLDALRLEIEPHFLFNTLNSIAALIRANDNRASLSMLLKLSDMMRTTLDRTAGHTAPLADELAVVTRYVDLQQARFGDRLEVVYRVDEACDSVPVPTFLLQPLVENALRHGIGPASHHGRLEIGATLDAGAVRLWVSDNGRGLPAGFDVARDAGTGLRNIRSRIARLYGQASTLRLAAGQSGGTLAEVIVPLPSSALPAGA